jgi:hypothetical protein
LDLIFVEHDAFYLLDDYLGSVSQFFPNYI